MRSSHPLHQYISKYVTLHSFIGGSCPSFSPLVVTFSPLPLSNNRRAPAGTRIYVHGNRPVSTGQTRSMLVARLLLLHGALQLAPQKFIAALRQS